MTTKVLKSNTCPKCKGEGRYMYDDCHIKPCELCCDHADGWWKMEKHYDSDNGKYACKIGCGTIVDKLPDDDALIQMTKDALVDVLGREPTRQEVLRAHAGFKRMAAVMYDHLSKTDREDLPSN